MDLFPYFILHRGEQQANVLMLRLRPMYLSHHWCCNGYCVCIVSWGQERVKSSPKNNI